MTAVFFLLLAASATCFILHAFGRGRRVEARVSLLSLGLFFWVLVPLIKSFTAIE